MCRPQGYTLSLSGLAKGYFLPILVHFSLGKGMLLSILVDLNVKLQYFLYKRNPNFSNLLQRMQIFGKFCLENAKSWHF